ncbi:MAG: alpha-amylase, partial [Marinirhabdus sp.]
MKHPGIALLSLFLLLSCNNETEKTKPVPPTTAKPELKITSAVLETSVIYEANIRQYSPEGTFNAFTKDIPQLKNLGVKIIWLMPVHPISLKRRKATNDTSIE